MSENSTTTDARDSVRISEPPVARDGRTMHPNSLANLRPFEPGRSGNPNGRPSIGSTWRDWIQELSREHDDGTPKYTPADLRGIADAPEDAPVSVAKRMAARRLLGMLADGRDGLADADFVFDRTEGKPGQSIAISADSAPAVQFNAPSPALDPAEDTPKLPDGNTEDSPENTEKAANKRQ